MTKTLIECLLRRVGGTQVKLGNIEYDFQPMTRVPKEADPHGHFCYVENETHVETFARIQEGYRVIGDLPAGMDIGPAADAEPDEIADLQQDEPIVDAGDPIEGDDDEPMSDVEVEQAIDDELDSPPIEGTGDLDKLQQQQQDQAQEPAGETSLADMDLDALRVVYEDMTGTKPHHKTKEQSLRLKIEELRAEA